MQPLLTVARGIDLCVMTLGRLTVAAIPFVVLLGASVVVLRYAFDLGYPWLSESFVWLNGVIFTIGAPYLLQLDKHVRVDVIYGRLSEKRRALVNIAGVVTLIWPAAAALSIAIWPSVVRSIQSLEASPSIDGLPFLYVLKVCVLLFFWLSALQGLSLFLTSIVALCRREGGRDA